MFDNHAHTLFSTDSTMTAIDACKAAIAQGLEGIAITDHVDLDYPDYEFNFDLKEYDNFIDELKSQYRGKLKILKGIELGIQPQVLESAEKIIKEINFDFVIASIHIIDYLDPYVGKFYKGKTKEMAYNRYLETILEGTQKFKDYDVIGHIGYIRRYGDYEDRSMEYLDFKDLIDGILKQVIYDGKGIEINTSGLRGILGTTIPDYSILKRYKQLGGEIITIGSDAHSDDAVGANFREAIELLKDVGFKRTCHFENRKIVWDEFKY